MSTQERGNQRRKTKRAFPGGGGWGGSLEFTVGASLTRLLPCQTQCLPWGKHELLHVVSHVALGQQLEEVRFVLKEQLRYRERAEQARGRGESGEGRRERHAQALSGQLLGTNDQRSKCML